MFWILFASFDQLLFFSPILTFYLPEDAIENFILSSITAAILGMVISMNVYALNQRRHHSSSMKNIKKSKKTSITSTASSLFSGSSLSILSTVCASCSSSLGFILTSIFGTGLGISVSTFLSNYQAPLRVVSVLILLWSWYSISKGIAYENSYCSIANNDNNKRQ